jgi:hypothetical protein
VKERVYSPRPRNLQELQDRLDVEIARLAMDGDLLRRCVRDIVPRAQRCLAAGGGYFE